MWLKHALKLTAALFVLSACSPHDRQAADKLNSLSYACHYRNIDSTQLYARQALLTAQHDDARAEALNNLAFASMVRMDYDLAQSQLDSVPGFTDNQLELLVSYVQQMRLCQRRSRNREFYDYRERAMTALKRINEERSQLSEREQRRLLYAESELAIVTSTYYYYMGLEQKSIDALAQMPADVKQDTAQFLNYLYNVGAGGILTEGTRAEIQQQEFDHLLRCFQIARQHGYSFFAANALEAMAEHLMEPDSRAQLIEDNAPGMKLINPEGVSDELLPVWLADNALVTFREYGDTYQIAGAYRTLASCYRAMGDYESALFNLEQSLSDSLILQAPDLVASIREQLSVAYAAIDEKPMSDQNRNFYLDLQEQTRQDRQLEARADQLERAVAQINWMLIAVCTAIVLLVFLLWLFHYLNQRQKQQTDSQLDDLLEQKTEQIALGRLHLEKSMRINLEQRAKISLVNSITPLIDRMLYAIDHLPLNIEQLKDNGQLDYVRELIDQIEADNEVLTQWIQLRQGELSLHIESFPLQPLFDIVTKSRTAFQMKGVSLHVDPTAATVKADRILTLFMLNTLADNARKFTLAGGQVNIGATESDDYVELSVSDTGQGMTEEQLATVFDRRVITDDKSQTSHGFGLLNCRGIIEKYRKLSHIFSVCTLQAESQEGKGSRFFFRLPKGVIRCLVIGVGCWAMAQSLAAAPQHPSPQHPTPITQHLTPQHPTTRASIYADSAYFSNINGNYQRTLCFADSCLDCLNEYYRQLRPDGQQLLQLLDTLGTIVPEIQWLHDSLDVNYNLLMDIRNESAVAALALHDWTLYQYNNRIYTLLFKELSADNTLADYCRTMQQSQTNKTVAVVLLVLVLVTLLPAYYLLYYRHRLERRFRQEQQLQDNVETLDDELRRTDLEISNLHVSNAVLDNCLSALKHETMYYPSRIRQLIDQGDRSSIAEVAGYYRELYGLLSLQAQRQVERTKLHLQRLDHGLLGDPVLIGYLFDLLKKRSGQRQLDVVYTPIDDRYVEIKVHIPHATNAPSQLSMIDQLLCRQIVRDHGEATNRRRCSIREEETADNSIQIIIILPAYGKV